MIAFAASECYETGSRPSRPRILLVDDRPENLILLEKILAKTQADLILARSGRQALEILDGQEVALVLLDVSMPDLSGLEVARQMQTSGQLNRTPVIFVTAFQENDGCVSNAYEAGAADFLMKPLRPNAVRAKVKLFLDLYAQRKTQELSNERLTQLQRDLSARNETLEAKAREITSMITQLEAHHSQLQRQNHELQGFAYVVSHDLLQPLHSVIDYVELIEHESGSQLSEEASRWLQACHKLGGTMSALINDALEYSPLAAEATALEATNCNEALQDALGLLNAAIKQSDARVTYGPLPIVTGSQRLLARLFQNLIGNAIKYRSAECLHVEIVSEWDQRYRRWLVCVKDNGRGIALKDQEHIFEMFSRCRDFEGVAGSGIGLAICRRIVETHGGEIWARSEPGQGSQFWFSLHPNTTTPAPVFGDSGDGECEARECNG